MMKVTVIGSGSFFFTRQMLKRMASSKIIEKVDIALVDINPDRCDRIGKYAVKFARETGNRINITYTTNRREALSGSDYVILSFSVNNVHGRGMGVHITGNYGILEGSGDTAGPGAVMRIIREIPEVLAVAKDVEELCPDAMVISYVNPTNVVTSALKRYTKVKCMGFCDTPHLPYFAPRILSYLKIEPVQENIDKLDIKMSGINHFGWALDMFFDGENVWNEFKTEMIRAGRDPKTPDPLFQAEAELLEMFNAWPTCMYHGVEYVRYFQGRGRNPGQDYVIQPWSLHKRLKLMKKFWHNVDAYNAGTMQREEAFKDQLHDGEMIGDVIESIEGDLNNRFPVNVVNEGRVSNLPNDTVVELYGRIGRNSLEVPVSAPVPRGPLGMIHSILDEQELALQAALTADPDLMVRAIACDPLVMSLNDAKTLAQELMSVEEPYLDKRWSDFWIK